MAQQSPADAVRAAVASISTCTPTTVVILKELLLSEEPDLTRKSNPKARTTGKSTQNGAQTEPRAKAPQPGAAAKSNKALSVKEKAALASHVINATLRALSDACKPPPSTPSRRQASQGELLKTASRNALRRSNSAPLSPLQPRTLNRTITSPNVSNKPRSSQVSTNASGCMSTAECARVAFTAMCALQDSSKVTLPEFQLEDGMSSFINKLIGLNFLDQASKELRVLTKRIEKHLGSAGKKLSKGGDTSMAGNIADLLDYGDIKASGRMLGLATATQIQVLRVLNALKKPSYIEAALPLLKDNCKSSPIRLLTRLAEADPAHSAKAVRQLEILSQLLVSMTPSASSRDDAVATEPRLSITPSTAFSLQQVALEAKLLSGRITNRIGDVEKEVLAPFTRYLSAFAKRTDEDVRAVYKRGKLAFERICQGMAAQDISSHASSTSPLATIYQTLSTLSRQAGQVGDSIKWTSNLRGLLNPDTDSVSKSLSWSAQLLSLQLKDPKTYLDSDDLLRQVVEGIQSPLSGSVTELEELLGNISLARKSATTILISKKTETDLTSLPKPTLSLLESLVMHCPRFCLRWLGKPPASKSSTKDFLKYEQRRLLLVKSIHHTLDSALMIIKTLVDTGKEDWATVDSILNDMLTLLDYLGDIPVQEASSSYYVKISHFYYMRYHTLWKSGDESTKTEALRGLRRSIDCIKHRPGQEKEKAQFLHKLQRLAEICKTSGRVGDALGALQTIRSSLLDDGVLAAVADAFATQPACLAWSSDERAENLSRTLQAIAKLEQVHLDWTVDLTEGERVAVLEHQLQFGVSSPSSRDASVILPLEHPCVESLLRIYYPTRYPIRRLRTLLRILSINICNPETAASIRPQLEAVIGLLDTEGFAEDVSLTGYLPHYRSLHLSLMALSDGFPELDVLSKCLDSWQSLVEASTTRDALECVIDNIPDLLAHLECLADFAKSMGYDSILTMTLELSSSIIARLASPTLAQKADIDASLALQYANIGECHKANQILEPYREISSQGSLQSPEAMLGMQLAFAEYYAVVRAGDKA